MSKALHLSGLHAPRGPWGEWVPRSWGWGQFSGRPLLCPQGQDAGTYTCVAENTAGRAHHRVHLTILALPVFTTLPGDRSLRVGDRLWLRCAARGSPTPRIGWTVNDRPVTGLGLLGAGGGGLLGGGPTGGETPPSREEEGVRQPGGCWVSRLGPLRGGTEQTQVWPYVTSHMSDLTRSHLQKRLSPRDLRAREGARVTPQHCWAPRQTPFLVPT